MPATPRLTTTFRRRLDATLGQGWPTRRHLGRCARLLQALLLQTPTTSGTAMPQHPPAKLQPDLPLPPSAAPAAETAPMTAPACPTCAGADLYASRARPGLFRCRHCGTVTGVVA